MPFFSKQNSEGIEVLPSKEGGLGTFGGVFTPSILTILGVIMYLRFGWVVGNVGLAGTLIIVTISTAITFLTAMSISAIATDQRVRIGGAYYMISRSLG
ncbi:Na-K-Cl cotransporter, partial [Balneolaceae bacterium ANBcel3]|nr:Na-K-Cl cotransporter [Balneolaceae bacterium ANBcel3]